MAADRPVICSFESRRAAEMHSLIERFGGVPVVAPSMQEVPLDQNAEALAAMQQIVSGSVSYVILLTGVGTEAMFRMAALQQIEAELLDALKRIPLLVRGPKPAAALAKAGLKYAVKAPEPNTWQQLMSSIAEANLPLEGHTVAVQEYGVPSPELYAELEARGATVLPVPIYRWALPDDIAPLTAAIRGTVQGEFDALLFTSAQQIRHVMKVASGAGASEEWLAAARQSFIGSIGPTCSEAIRETGLEIGFEASPPKMGPLVRGVIEALRTETV